MQGLGDNNTLYAINPNGTLKWEFNAFGIGWWSSPTIGDDGTIYIGSIDNHLYAIHSDSGGLANTPWAMLQHDAQHTGRVDGVTRSLVGVLGE